MHFMLLPGLHGGDSLYDTLRAHLPTESTSEVVSYPDGEFLDYSELEALVRERAQAHGKPFMLVAESFAGPLGIRVAADPPSNLKALCLIATFARPPVPSWLRFFVGPYLFWRPPPSPLVRYFFSGAQVVEAALRQVQRALGKARPAVLSARVNQVLRVDVRAELARITVPTLCFEGSEDHLVRGRGDLALVRPDLEWATFDAPHLVAQHLPAEAAARLVEFAHTVEGLRG